MLNKLIAEVIHDEIIRLKAVHDMALNNMSLHVDEKECKKIANNLRDIADLLYEASDG